jgi:NADPH:quinone reductase-like Zn-dependent oxidoreductase
MRAWQLHNFGLDNLRLAEAPTPTPKDDEVLIKVGAVSLIPVSDAVGTVVAVGKSVTHLKEGDRVNSHLYSHWIDGLPAPNEPAFCYGTPLPGGLAEYMTLHAASAVKAPEAMTDE